MKVTKRKVVFFSFIVFAAMLCVATWVDYSRVRSSKSPLFTYASAHYKDGGSVRLSGIFYTVTDMSRISMIQLSDGSYRELTRVGYTYEHAFLPLSFDQSHQIEGDVISE
jgi:hypothetical protein